MASKKVVVTTYTDGILDPGAPMLGPVKNGGLIEANTMPSRMRERAFMAFPATAFARRSSRLKRSSGSMMSTPAITIVWTSNTSNVTSATGRSSSARRRSSARCSAEALAHSWGVNRFQYTP